MWNELSEPTLTIWRRMREIFLNSTESILLIIVAEYPSKSFYLCTLKQASKDVPVKEGTSLSLFQPFLALSYTFLCPHILGRQFRQVHPQPHQSLLSILGQFIAGASCRGQMTSSEWETRLQFKSEMDSLCLVI